MSQWRLPIVGTENNAIKQEYVRDSDSLVLHSQQDCRKILDENQRLRREGGSRGGKGGFVAARVPAILMYIEWPVEFEMKYGCHPKRAPVEKQPEVQEKWSRFLREKLRDRDYDKLRTDDRKI